MSDSWFRLPNKGEGTVTNPSRPDLFGHEVDGWVGNKNPSENAPIWFVRVYADRATLDDLANENAVTELDNVPVQALNNLFGQDRDAEGWNRGFRVGES